MTVQEQTLKSVCEEAVKSHPVKYFTVDDIVKSVREVRPEANKASIRTCIQRDLKGAKIIHVAKIEGKKNVYALGDGDGKAIVKTRKKRKKVSAKRPHPVYDYKPDPTFEFEKDQQDKNAKPTAPLSDDVASGKLKVAESQQDQSDESDEDSQKITAQQHENRLTFDSYQVGESIIAYIASIRQDVISYRIKISDLETKMKNQQRQFSETLREKDKTIETLNQRIQALNNIKRSMGKANTVSFKMNEVARVTGSQL